MISIVIPTRRGGQLLQRVLAAIGSQVGVGRYEVICVDSGSQESELAAMARAGARVERVAVSDFDHGATRDSGIRLARGSVYVLLNQDALPAGDRWLEKIVAPFDDLGGVAAVQGSIQEFSQSMSAAIGRRRFYWDSCGPRFYFTRESEGWIAQHGGIGFSTVNCAIARWAWEQQPFGPAAILEDKLWQKRAAERGWRIVEAPEAAVWHTHDYDLRTLTRRCLSEGYGWRLVGESYRLSTALGDLVRSEVWRDWCRGVRSGALRRPAELLFPALRPLALWWGNRWARGVRP